jgi:hypothetical protein
MMIRELIKNAIEAAINAPPGRGRIEISATVFDGVDKLTIWNTGPGMNAGELFRMCDIASTIRKQKGLDENFGMGAKVASLPSNQHGIRFRSCKDGRAYQVLLGKRNDIYGRVRQWQARTSTYEDVVDVTEFAATEQYTLDFDWTEVVLLGNRPDQNTVTDPYDSSPKVSSTWVLEALYYRFFKLPIGIDIILHEGTHSGSGSVKFAPISSRVLTDFTRSETVEVLDGLKFHFLYDGVSPVNTAVTLSSLNALQPARSGVGLLYKDEIYDLRSGWRWLHSSPIYGIPFGAKSVSVLIELPDYHPVSPDAYRQFLQSKLEGQKHVEPEDFSRLVSGSRPSWLVALLQQLAPDTGHVDNVRDELSELFRLLKVRRRWWPNLDTNYVVPSGIGEPPYEVGPEIVGIRDLDDAKSRGLDGKAAKYFPQTHQLFVNFNYPTVEVLKETLELEFSNLDDIELVRRLATVISESIVARNIGRQLVFGLSKQGRWEKWEIDQAISAPSLSLAVDDHAMLVQQARKDFEFQLAHRDPA